MLTCGDIDRGELAGLLAEFDLRLEWVEAGASIPGTYWGEPEAGLIGGTLHVRADTPLHSALHEGSHFICMDAARRARLHTDAGGTLLEECAVCYLQIILGGRLSGVGRTRIQADMDTWGYTFRLGSAQAWFEADAEDARAFLAERNLPVD
jgi:hypothetical protein